MMRYPRLKQHNARSCSYLGFENGADWTCTASQSMHRKNSFSLAAYCLYLALIWLFLSVKITGHKTISHNVCNHTDRHRSFHSFHAEITAHTDIYTPAPVTSWQSCIFLMICCSTATPALCISHQWAPTQPAAMQYPRL
jgi:hypothetical protein